jgi:hypothetical protein
MDDAAFKSDRLDRGAAAAPERQTSTQSLPCGFFASGEPVKARGLDGAPDRSLPSSGCFGLAGDPLNRANPDRLQEAG